MREDIIITEEDNNYDDDDEHNGICISPKELLLKAFANEYMKH